MKKYLCALLAIFIAAALCGCVNYGQQTIGDRNDDIEAIVKLADGTIITGDVDEYKRWGDSTIQIKIDGVIYTVHPLNVTLISEG